MKSIILIGPIDTGKTTIGELLSQQLNRKWVEMDGLRFQYYQEIGYDEGVAWDKRQTGLAELVAYWKPFEIHAVERILADHPDDCVIDFGAGHSVYEDPSHLERAKRALQDYPNVILLLPSPDIAESLKILADRQRSDDPKVRADVAGLNEHFLNHHSNYELAKMTVYTKDKLPEETCDEIMGKLNS
jgi:shikimate kinase